MVNNLRVVRFERSGGMVTFTPALGGEAVLDANRPGVRSEAYNGVRPFQPDELAMFARLDLAALRHSHFTRDRSAPPPDLRDGYQYDITLDVSGSLPIVLVLYGELAAGQDTGAPGLADLAAWVGREIDAILAQRVRLLQQKR